METNNNYLKFYSDDNKEERTHRCDWCGIYLLNLTFNLILKSDYTFRICEDCRENFNRSFINARELYSCLCMKNVLKKIIEPYFQKCFWCRHFRNEEFNSPRAGCWYNHFCSLSRQKLEISEELYSYFKGGKSFPNCRYVYDYGKCSNHRKEIKIKIEKPLTRFELLDFDT